MKIMLVETVKSMAAIQNMNTMMDAILIQKNVCINIIAHIGKNEIR